MDNLKKYYFANKNVLYVFGSVLSIIEKETGQKIQSTDPNFVEDFKIGFKNTFDNYPKKIKVDAKDLIELNNRALYFISNQVKKILEKSLEEPVKETLLDELDKRSEETSENLTFTDSIVDVKEIRKTQDILIHSDLLKDGKFYISCSGIEKCKLISSQIPRSEYNVNETNNIFSFRNHMSEQDSEKELFSDVHTIEISVGNWSSKDLLDYLQREVKKLTSVGIQFYLDNKTNIMKISSTSETRKNRNFDLLFGCENSIGQTLGFSNINLVNNCNYIANGKIRLDEHDIVIVNIPELEINSIVVLDVPKEQVKFSENLNSCDYLQKIELDYFTINLLDHKGSVVNLRGRSFSLVLQIVYLEIQGNF